MAKEQVEVTEPVVVDKPQQPPIVRESNRSDTRTVVIAVGASIVLFLVGLILGYLLGHQMERGERMRDTTTRVQQGIFRHTIQPETTN